MLGAEALAVATRPTTIAVEEEEALAVSCWELLRFLLQLGRLRLVQEVQGLAVVVAVGETRPHLVLSPLVAAAAVVPQAMSTVLAAVRVAVEETLMALVAREPAVKETLEEVTVDNPAVVVRAVVVVGLTLRAQPQLGLLLLTLLPVRGATEPHHP